MSNNLLTVNEVAKRLKVTRATVYALMNRGELTYTTVGQRRRVEESEIERYIEKNRRRESTSDRENDRVSPCVVAA
jgi:excisionase family DNA binding protein